jgi:hypothetical protein
MRWHAGRASRDKNKGSQEMTAEITAEMTAERTAETTRRRNDKHKTQVFSLRHLEGTPDGPAPYPHAHWQYAVAPLLPACC